MSSAQQPGVVIIGSGLAGYTLARELRKQDPDTAITEITRDGGESYSKPMLSNALSQQKSDAQLVQKTASQIEADLKAIVLTFQQVTAIDRAAKTVTLETGKVVEYTNLVLALGADPRPAGLNAPVCSVNDLADFRQWREKLDQPRRILLIGAGLVGCEFANDLVSAGHQVVMVDPAPWPLGRLLPQKLGDQMTLALQEAGIEVHLTKTVSEMNANSAVLSDGIVVPFDFALSAIGLIPRVDLALQAGLTVGRGIVVDRTLKTSDPYIYALGDCAQSPAGVLPFVLPLMAQARTLALVLAKGQGSLVLPALPIVVKTPCLPLAVCPPAPDAVGEWRVEGEGRDLKAVFTGPDGAALGFALSGIRAAERQALGKVMPDLLA